MVTGQEGSKFSASALCAVELDAAVTIDARPASETLYDAVTGTGAASVAASELSAVELSKQSVAQVRAPLLLLTCVCVVALLVCHGGSLLHARVCVADM